MTDEVTEGRKEPLTDADLARMKADNLEEFPHHIVDGDPKKQAYLCEDCDHRRTCVFSMDPYNTPGDCCLAAK